LSGAYFIKPAGSSTALSVYCDMVNDGGGWMLLTPAMVESQYTANVTIASSSDINGGLVRQVWANARGCGEPAESRERVYFTDTVPWTKIRSTWTFAGGVSCWSILGNDARLPGWSGRLTAYTPGTDTIRNQAAMGGSNGNLFDGITARCDNTTANFWHHLNGTGERTAQVILRRTATSSLAGLGVGASCVDVGAGSASPTWWKYSDIYVNGGTAAYTYALTTNASGATINAASGLYKAGPHGGVTDKVTVTNAAGGSATATITVTAGVSLTPAAPTTAPRGSLNFSAAGGSAAGYTYTLSTNASGATIDAATGAYTAGSTGGVSDVVTATDSLGNAGTATILVTPGVSITPSSMSLAPKASQRFAASGGSNVGLTYALSTNASGGTINATTGAYTAGPTGSVTDVVTATDSLGNTASATITVTVGLSISPSTAITAPKSSLAFDVTGGSHAGVTYALSTNASGGSVGATTGVYIAGATGSVTDVVTATDSLGNTAAATITVTAAASLTPSSATTAPRGTVVFTASGGSSAGFEYAVSTNASGGSVNPTTGRYSAGSTGSVQDVVTATDSLGNTVSATITVTAGLSLSPTAPTTPPKGTVAFAASGGSGAGLTYALTTNASGGSINPATGAYLAGAAGATKDVVTVTDSLGNSASATVSVTPALSLVPASKNLAPRGTLTLFTTGGSGAGIVYALSTNASGGSIDATTGAYAAGNTGSVTDVVTATDSLGNTASATIHVTAAVSITPAGPTTAPQGTVAFSASGGSGAGYTYTFATNASGATLNATTGAYKAGTTGSVTDVVTVTDSLGNTASATVTVTASLTVSPAAAASTPRGAVQLTATGGSGAGFTFSFVLNTSGASLNPMTGAYVAGTFGPTVDTIVVTDSLGNTATATISVSASLSVSPPSSSVAPRGAVAFAAAGGSGAGYFFALTTNASGGSVDPATGAYAAGKTGSVTDVVTLEDSLGNVATANITVGAALTISPTMSTAPPRGAVAFVAMGGSGAGYTFTFAANGSGGAIDAATGAYVAGSHGNAVDRVVVTDGLGSIATAEIMVGPGITITPSAASIAPRGAAHFAASGGSGAGFAYSFGKNTSGATLDAVTGDYTAGTGVSGDDQIVVTDSLGNTASAMVTVTAHLGLTPSHATLPPRGAQRFAATGGSGAGLVFALSTNASGGTVDPVTGAYAAGPKGNVTDTVTVTDSLGNTATAGVDVTAVLAITPGSTTSAPNATVAFSTTGGSGAGLTYVIAKNGSGATIDAATGLYHAGPTPGVADTVTVTDSVGNTASADVTVGPGVSITPSASSIAPRDSFTLVASGGSGAGYVFTLTVNASGATVDPASGLYRAGNASAGTDVLTVHDSVGNTATALIDVTALLRVAPEIISVAPEASISFLALGGSGAGLSWSLDQNNSGASIDPVTGTYMAGPTGSTVDIVRVADSLGNIATGAVSVGSGLAISPASPTVAPRQSQTFTALGGSGTGFTYSLVVNASGGAIDPLTGIYNSGTVGGTRDVVRVKDSLGNAAEAAITVTASLTVTPAHLTVAPLSAAHFSVAFGAGAGYVWSLPTNNSGATLDQGGAYTAGPIGLVTDTLQVTDALGNVATASVDVSASIAITPSHVALAPRQSQHFAGTGGSGKYVFEIVTNASGATLDAAGAYTAGPKGGVADVIRVKDDNGESATARIDVGAELSVAPGTSGVAPRQTVAFTAHGGSSAGVTWLLDKTPSGGTIDATTGAYKAGAIGGVTDVVRATDSLGNTATASVAVGVAITIKPFAPSTTTRGAVGFAASGGTNMGFVWSLARNNSGASIDPKTGGYHAGATGSVMDVVHVVDDGGNESETNVQVGPALSVSPAAPIAAPLDKIAFTVSGGSGKGYAFALTLNGSGGKINALTGLYVAGPKGDSLDIVTATDSLGNTSTVTVTVGHVLQLDPAAATVAPGGSLQLLATGGRPPYTFTLIANGSHARVNAQTGAYVAGHTPNADDVVRVRDQNGVIATAAIHVSDGITLTPSAASLPPLGHAVFTASGGSGAGYTYRIVQDPSGKCTIAPDGTFDAGPKPDITVMVEARDSFGNHATASILVGNGLLVSPTAPTVVPLGQLHFAVQGGSLSGYQWFLKTNASGGTITPDGNYQAGRKGFVTDVVAVQDALGNVGTTVVHVSAPVRISPVDVTIAPYGKVDFTITGGTGTGYILNEYGPAGVVPSETLSFVAGGDPYTTAWVQAVDSFDNRSVFATIHIGAALALSPSQTSVSPRGTQPFHASGGQPPYTFSLPLNASGATIDPHTGLYTGGATPIAEDMVLVTDANGATQFALIFTGPGVTITPDAAATTPRGKLSFSAYGGSGKGFIFAMATSASGGTVDKTTGAYTAGTTGNVTDQVFVTDSLGNTAKTNIAVGKSIAITPAAPTIAPGRGVTFKGMYASGAVRWSLTMNNSGGAVNETTGEYLAGTTGDVTDVLRAEDDLGNTAETPITITSGLMLLPRATAAAPGDIVPFHAAHGCSKGYVFDLEKNGSGATIDPKSGVYKAGTKRYMDTVRVTDACGNVARSTVILGAQPDPVDIATLPEGHGVDGNCSYAPTTPREIPSSVALIIASALALLSLRRRTSTSAPTSTPTPTSTSTRTSRRAMGTFIGVVLLFIASSARAQEWLASPELRDGAGVDLGVAVLHPGVGAEAGFDSNWFAQSKRLAQGTPVLRLTPSLALDTDVYRGPAAPPTNYRLRAVTALTYREFFGSLSPEQRNATGNANLALDLFSERAFSARLGASYLRSVQAPFDEDLIPYFNSPRSDLEASARLRGQLTGKGSLEAGYRLHKKLFEDEARAAYSNTLHQADAVARYALTDETNLMADGAIGFLSFDQGKTVSPELISPLYKSVPLRAHIGAEYNISKRLETRARIGYGSSQIDRQASPFVHQFHSVIGAVEGKFLLFPKATDRESATLSQSAVTLAYTRDFKDNYLANFHTLDRVSVRLEYYWRGGVLLATESGGALVQHPTAFFSDGSIRQDAFAETRLDTLLFAEVRPWESIGLNFTTKYTANLSNVTLDQSPLLTPAQERQTAGMRWSRLELYGGFRWFL
jgi:hypothetical protein